MHNPPILDEGVMQACNDPGHGVQFDWDVLNAYRQNS